jgi:hypothetical protein
VTAQPRPPRAPKATGNGSSEAVKIEELEAKIAWLDWFRAEQQFRIMNLANALALLLTQASQAQVQQSILGQLLGQQPPVTS